MSRRVSLLAMKSACQSIESLRAMYPDPNAVKPIPQKLDPVFDASKLPVMQQAALIGMMESHVKRTIVFRLLEDAQDRPHLPDYAALVRAGLAEYQRGKRFHDLTMQGRFAARALEQKLCQQFSIHLMIDAGKVGWEQKYSCPCGQWSTHVRRSTTSDSNARLRFNRHLSTANGMATLTAGLKPVAMVEG